MSDFISKIKSLPQLIRDFTSSDVPMFELKKSFALSGVNSSKSQLIAGDIGLMYVGDLRIGGLPKLIQQKVGVDEKVSVSISYEINKRIFNKFPEYFKDSSALLEEWGRIKAAPVLSEAAAWKKVLELEPWIAELENEKMAEGQAEQRQKAEKLAALVQMKLQEALKKYDRLGEQLLSGNPIKLKIFEAPVRPSIKNWIADYYEKVDARKHDSIERGNYLFHSDNARRLTTGERQRVGTMLRALDEDGMLAIDTQKQELVFQSEVFSQNTESRTPQISSISGANSRPGMSFSSPHKFPSESNRTAPVLPKPNQLRASGNIVDLRE
jgi:hypothetical protein